MHGGAGSGAAGSFFELVTALPESGQTTSPATWDRIKDPNRVSGVPSKETDTSLSESRKQKIFLQDARERFRDSVTASRKQREEGLQDVRFSAGMQWEENIQAIRDAQGRPCSTVNRIPGFTSHVVNAMRQQRPEIKIDPVAGGVDEKIAAVRQGLIRHIEIRSNADIAYDTGFESMVTSGLGYLRVVDEWSDPKSFDMDLRIEWVSNRFSVYEDPAAAKPDWSDGKFRFIVEDVTLAEFRRRYGRDRSPASLDEFKSIGDDQPNWIVGGKIRIAEYFHIEEEDDILYELEDGTGVYESEIVDWEDDDPRIAELKLDEDGEYVTRDAKRQRIMWTLMYGLGVLKEREWPGKYIPVIPIIGSQIELDGERILVGMVRYARESQRMFNYMYSCFIEVCALAPKAPWVVDMQSIQEFEDFYKNANTMPQAYLPYNARAESGQLVAPPRRENSEPPIQAFVEGLKLADENLKSVFRIYDASLGQKGPQESGIAINSRKIESDLATYDWADNFTRALRFLGVVLDDLLQYYYNRPGRIIQILQEDLSRKDVTMNQPVDEDGETQIYDLSKGKFAVVASTGPTAETRRREETQAILDLAKMFPANMVSALPMLIRSMDWPGKDAVADQVEKTLPKELQSPDPDAPKDDPAQLKDTLSQAMQQIQLLSKALTEATDKRTAEREKEMWATFRVQMQQEVALATAEMKTRSADSQSLVAELFEEMKRVRMITESFMNPAGSTPQPSSATPGAPSAPALPQVPPSALPPQGENTPAGVGTGQ